ncbi:hypothetical protein D3C78_1821760 [compost metagenome]
MQGQVNVGSVRLALGGCQDMFSRKCQETKLVMACTDGGIDGVGQQLQMMLPITELPFLPPPVLPAGKHQGDDEHHGKTQVHRAPRMRTGQQ